MRRIIPMLLVALTLTACAEGVDAPDDQPTTPPTSGPTTRLETVDVPELGFSIGVPTDWTHAVDSRERLFQATAGRPTNGYLPNFNVTSDELPDEIPVAAYFDSEVGRLEEALPDVEILETANLEVDGSPARGITLTSTEAGTTIGISRLLVVRDGTAYEATFFSEARALEDLAPMVTDIFQSLQFLD